MRNAQILIAMNEGLIKIQNNGMFDYINEGLQLAGGK